MHSAYNFQKINDSVERIGNYKVTLDRHGDRRVATVLAEGRQDATFRAERLNPGWVMVIAEVAP